MPNVKDMFEGLGGDNKSKLVTYAVWGGLILLALGLWWITDDGQNKFERPEEPVYVPASTMLDDYLFEERALDRIEQQAQEERKLLEQQLAEKEKAIQSANAAVESVMAASTEMAAEQAVREEELRDEFEEKLADMRMAIMPVQTGSEIKNLSESKDNPGLNQAPSVPGPLLGNGFPPPPGGFQQQGFNTNRSVMPEQDEYFSVEGSTLVGGFGGSTYKPKKVADKKKAGQGGTTFRLTPSLMEAYLLTGMEAMTTIEAQGNPEPVAFRVQADAVLPNGVLANTEGCMIIGNVVGNLAKHRVDVRLANITCVDPVTMEVAHGDIDGFVTDDDGKHGLRANPVWRAGSMLARTAAAGLAEGFTSQLELNTVNQSVSALGSTTAIDPAKGLQAGIGKGLSEGSRKLSKIYADIAQQTAPVLESGATRPVEITITRMVELSVEQLVETN